MDAVGLDHNPILADTTAEAALTPTETVPGHTTGAVDAITFKCLFMLLLP